MFKEGSKMSQENVSLVSSNTGDEQERRVHHDLRIIFDTACVITAPFFDPKHGWGSTSLTLYARQALRERYPELTQQEVAILFSGIERSHIASHKK